MFITPAYAQASGAASALGGQDFLIQIVPFAAVFAIMYFFLLRPQQQRAKAQQALVQAAKRGDTIVTSGGLVGKVTKSTDAAEVEMEIAPNVRVRVMRSGIADIRSPGDSAKDASAPASPSK